MTGTEDEFRELLDGVARRTVPERERLGAVRARRRRLRARRALGGSLAAVTMAGAAGIGYAATRDRGDGAAAVSAGRQRTAVTGSLTPATSATATPQCPPGQVPSETVTLLKTAGGQSSPEAAVRAAGHQGTLRRTGSSGDVVVLAESDAAGRVVASYDVTEVRTGSWGVSAIRVPGPCVATGADER